MDKHPGEQVLSLEMSESEWAAVVAGLYALENQQRRLHHEAKAIQIHYLRRALHRQIGRDLVEKRGGGENAFTYGFPGDDE